MKQNAISKRKSRLTALLLSALLIGTMLLGACSNGDSSAASKPESSADASLNTASDLSAEESSQVIDLDGNAEKIWLDSYADSVNGITGPSDIYKATLYYNGAESEDYTLSASSGDTKYLFESTTDTRIVNPASGYMLTMPGTNLKTDFTLSALRCKYTNDTSVLTVTYEDKNPYGNTEKGWETYNTEWLSRYINNLDFLAANSIMRTRASKTYTDLLDGYEVTVYDMFIKLSKNITYPYYNIAVIRKADTYDKFWLLVMKSTEKSEEEFDKILASFVPTDFVGKAANAQGAYEQIIPETWSDETKAYYEKLVSQDTCDWGVFSVSLPSSKSGDITSADNRLAAEIARLEGADGLNYRYDILPTYTHIAWYDTQHYFPSELAEKYAGGNGFDGKPVLQFTYQYTISNNTNLAGYTPMYDILRGTYDDLFHTLAKDIKAYEKPVLFRLCNEMNTDWTSYCGMLTMLDPDFFIETWKYLYNIFEEEGVNNCIWIFNPIATSTPYSNWGDTLNYMPGAQFVQALGLTYYEMGNGSTVSSFREMYTSLYEQNTPYFDNYPAIISEFACGSGGEKNFNWNTMAYDTTKLHRNEAKQAKWVKEMFECFAHSTEPGYEFCKNIKGAVWFSTNDYVEVDGSSYISNCLRLDEELTETLKAFREGLALTHQE